MMDMKAHNSFNAEWDIITTILDNTASKAERKLFDQWLSEGSNRQFFKEIKHVWNKSGDLAYCYGDETNTAWESIREKTIQKSYLLKRKKTRAIRFLQVAAAILLLVVAGRLMFFSNTQKIESGEAIMANYMLPDSSIVSLNIESALTYKTDFKGKYREVWLNGEAFFDVKPDKEKPFIIHVDEGDFRVLGTSFNIKALESGSLVTLNVETGSVQFSSNEIKKPVITEEGSSILFNRMDKTIHKTVLDPNYLAWKTKKIIFKDTPMTEVVTCLESVYHKQIHIKDDRLKELNFSAKFDDQSLEKILKVLALTFDLEINEVNGVIELAISEE